MRRLTALLLCLCLFLCGCTREEAKDPGIFYYKRTETAYTGSDGVFAPDVRELRGIRRSLDALLELYCAGPSVEGLENPLPQGAAVTAWTLDGDVLTLDFNTALAQLSDIDLTIAAGCLARTFLPLTGARQLVLSAGGELLDGQAALRLTNADLALRDNSLDRLLEELTVYYTDSSRRYLIGQEVRVDPSAQESVPFQLLELLLTPPEGGELRSALPVGTRIESVSLEDGLCTVGLNSVFENRRFYSHTAQLLSLMSMVNTLTALPQIERVEFVVGGRLLIRYGALSIPEPLVRDERCIGPVRTGLGEQDITVYLAHGSEGRLLDVALRMPHAGAMSQAERVLRCLLGDSGANGISTRIPTGTKVNSVTILGSVCFVDLSREYLDQPEDLLHSGRVIAAALCAQEGISQVQILVDGNIPADYDSALFGPLCPNPDWFL